MQELDAVNTRRFTKEEVFTIMKVPPIICGEMKSDTFASAKIAEKIFAKYTIYPIVTQIQEVFNKYLFNGI
jgi:phage portal protein BeeE